MPGIFQLKLPIPNNPLGYTNPYLLQGDDEYLLIDTGVNTEEAFQSLKWQLAEIGVSLKDITQIIVTHAHHDHYGLAGRLKQNSPAKIALHHLETDSINPGYLDPHEFIRQSELWFRQHGVPTDELPTPHFVPMGMRGLGLTPPDITLHGGETITCGIFNLQVLWTPGHAPGHICLYEPNQKILFSGDHILPVITPNVSLHPHSPANPLGDFLNSLNKVKQLDVNLVLPAHEHLFTDLPARVEEIIQHHQQRNSEILEALRTKPKTAYQIANLITWMPEQGGFSFRDLAPWDRRAAVSETLAHLEALRVEGEIAKFAKNNLTHYQLT